MKFMMNTKVTSSSVEGEKVKLQTEASKGGKEKELEADVVLVSTGRRPFTQNIGLEALNIGTDKMGRIEVNDHFQTSVRDVNLNNHKSEIINQRGQSLEIWLYGCRYLCDN